MKRVAWLGLLIPLCGCSPDPADRIENGLVSRNRTLRADAVASASGLDDARTLALLVDTLENDDDLLDATARALVLRGREWERAHGGRGKARMNPVIAAVGETAAKRNLAASVRAKAVFVLGEVGSRRAKPQIADAASADSMAVQREQARALDKLGFTDTARAFEVTR